MPFPPPKAQGTGVQFPNLPGNPRTTGLYPKAMEQGRMLEQSIGDASQMLIDVKKDVMDKIKGYIDDCLQSVDCELPDPVRPAALVTRIVKLIQTIQAYMADVQNIISAIQACIQVLMQMINNIRAMIQGILNALSNLMAQLCNWNLPDLPSFPNFFGPFLNFQGFNLGHMKFPSMDFNFKFSMKDCNIHLPNVDLFRNQPKGVWVSVGGLGFHVPNFYNVPWGGTVVNLSALDGSQRAQVGLATAPYFNDPFDAESVVTGDIPKASAVVSNYHLPNEQYKSNITMMLGQEFRDLAPRTTDPDYGTYGTWPPTGWSPTSGTPRMTQYLAALRRVVVLENVVDSGFDPNVVAAWCFWLDLNRQARQGLWVSDNQAAYDSLVAPTLSYLATTPIPHNQTLSTAVQPMALSVSSSVMSATFTEVPQAWKAGQTLAVEITYLDQDGNSQSVNDAVTVTQVSGLTVTTTAPGSITSFGSMVSATFNSIYDSPADMPFIGQVKPLGANEQGPLLWRLSFVEAGLLGLPRNTRWDAHQQDPLAVPDYQRIAPSGVSQETTVTWDMTTTVLKSAVQPASSAPLVPSQGLVVQNLTVTSSGGINYGSSGYSSPLLGESGSVDYGNTASTSLGAIQINHDKLWSDNLALVLSKARVDIQGNTHYVTGKAQYLYYYDAFANVIPTDRFTQFWKTFNDNWTALLAQDPLLQSYVVADWRILDGAVNPLGDPAMYNTLLNDWNSRDNSWQAGQKLLRLPPNLSVQSTVASPADPQQAGWNMTNTPLTPTGAMDVTAMLNNPDPNAVPVLDAQAFLDRPDISQLPLPVQTAMLEINQAYISAMTDATKNLFATNSLLTTLTKEADSMKDFVSLIMANSTNNPLPDRDSTGAALNVPGLSGALGGLSGTGGTGGVTPGGTTTTQAGVMKFKAITNTLPIGSVVALNSDGKVAPIDPTVQTDTPPYFDGVTLTAPDTSLNVDVITVYGNEVTCNMGQQWVKGDLVYCGASGRLTTDYPTVLQTCQWIVILGKAVGPKAFLYEPSIPLNTMLLHS